ncbi:hypothetical protein CONPUDRAFT_159501 [Coniophora puteana RWD-64-598 SS2]|uniref:Uncharacterized protein n=1 Tax=Coniophora puteana (strain RWD-64-598) TaxID=741705 RepID=A0A5M3M9A4_CONPW|nr:uncharacterized protein CONPUDRAFT_159501 [Coniophora puteana RWD-64-598 SS2]EIW75380.1 hypothetical protein CONPUDRAFT_159501 [Coniophora puteana RWD-64-598 SS2]
MRPAEDTAAWVVVDGCKSASRTLHVAASSTVSPILDYFTDVATSSGEYAEAVLALLRRHITALVFHYKDPEQFTPLANALVTHLGAHVSSIASTDASIDGGDQEKGRLKRMLLVCGVACSVRQGTRMSTLLTHLPALPLIPALQSTLLQHT